MSTSIYNPNIPVDGESIADLQIDMLNNFQRLYFGFNQDHVAISNPSTDITTGLHTNCKFIPYLVTTPPSTQFDEMSIHSHPIPNQTDQFFLRYASNGPDIQFSQYTIVNLAPIMRGAVTLQIPYYTFLPGGIVVYFGTVFGNSAGNNQIILNPQICNNILSVSATPIKNITVNPPLVLRQPSFIPQNSGEGTTYQSITMFPSTGVAADPLGDQYYLIFGNII